MSYRRKYIIIIHFINLINKHILLFNKLTFYNKLFICNQFNTMLHKIACLKSCKYIFYNGLISHFYYIVYNGVELKCALASQLFIQKLINKAINFAYEYENAK